MSMLNKLNSTTTNTSDANLVLASLGGDRTAFGEIVAKYQNLLCSLAYSSVGDIKHSEDIAQETFVEAWKKLNTLKDPEKLKAWLCGILKFKVSRYRRVTDNQTLKQASDIDIKVDQAPESLPMDEAAISEQEQNLLWQAINKMESNYREPLVLFYREHQSIERVASELDLSIDAAKKRLSRGRSLLKQAMTTFVEEGLAKSKPSISFTTGVLAAIEGVAPPAQIAGVGVGSAKAGALFKISSFIIFLAAFSGVISSFFGVKAALAQSRTQNERMQVFKVVAIFFSIVIVYILGMFLLKHLAITTSENLIFYATSAQILVFGFTLSYLFLVYKMIDKAKALRAQERILNAEAFQRPIDQKTDKKREYKSRLKLLGIPLFHFQFSSPEYGDTPAVAWVAGGTTAYGLLFAWGAIAIAPISVGIVSVGIVSIGAVGFGLIGLGTVGIGIIGFGSAAIGYKAYAAFSALGWESAVSGGFSIAKDAAIAPIAFAAQVNTEAATKLSHLALLEQSYLWVLAFISALVIIPAILHSHQVRQRMSSASDEL
ncbi:RNA polymerase sigma factor [Catenovulum maritimum]|uniref:RNA polymerase sigma factor n=1 Tax=Catenovulum maritimum TaxID=1513271 RepID=A0A0J8H1B8_9ALTE|nr:sigma-70 family RNA polymerase sigma factor [Catenovulum maritimum]KMT66818.1 RNA polymerase [Catenovulum maritimum]